MVTDSSPVKGVGDRRAVWAAAGVVIAQVALLAWSATRHAPSWDEVGHLAAGVSHWRSGWFDAYRVNPPLARLAATWPAVLSGADIDWSRYDPEPWQRTEFALGKRFIAQHGPDSIHYFVICRWASLPFAVLGGWVCFVWARQLYGRAAGVAAVTLWAVSPNVLAHAQLVTPDTAAAALGALACLAFSNWLRSPSWPRAAGMGIATGFALLAKFTLLVLGPILLAVWVVRAARDRAGAREQIAQMAVAGALALYVINLGYGFEDSFRPLGEFEFVSENFAGRGVGPAAGPMTGNRFAGTGLGRAPVPLPANYLMGIDVQQRDFEQGMDSYLRGEWRKGGWWYYYLYGLLVKEPVGTLALAVLAIGTVFRHPRGVRGVEVVPVACAIGIIGVVSSQTGFNHHLRYVLPALPLAYISLCRVFAPGGPRWLAGVGAVCIVASAVSSLLAYPHSMSYFNELAGGPKAGPRHMHNSNVDWGQDLLFLKEWCDRHPDRRPLYVEYSGGFDAATLRCWGDGVHHTWDEKTQKALAGGTPLPGWYAIFVGRLFEPPDDPDLFARFRRREPDERIGDTVYLFRE